MLHKVIAGGEHYLPYAMKQLEALRRQARICNLTCLSRGYEMPDGSIVIVKINGDQEHIILQGSDDIFFYGLTDSGGITKHTAKGSNPNFSKTKLRLPQISSPNLRNLNGYPHYLGNGLIPQFSFIDFQPENPVTDYPIADTNGDCYLVVCNGNAKVSGLTFQRAFNATDENLWFPDTCMFPMGQEDGQLFYGLVFQKQDAQAKGNDQHLFVFNEKMEFVEERPMFTYQDFSTRASSQFLPLGNGRVMGVHIPVEKNGINDSPPLPCIVETNDFGRTWTKSHEHLFKRYDSSLNKEVSIVDITTLNSCTPKLIYAGNSTILLVMTVFNENGTSKNVLYQSTDSGVSFNEVFFPVSSPTNLLFTGLPDFNPKNNCFGEGCVAIPYLPNANFANHCIAYTLDYGSTWTLATNLPDNINAAGMSIVKPREIKSDGTLIEPEFVAIGFAGSVKGHVFKCTGLFEQWKDCGTRGVPETSIGKYGDYNSFTSMYGKDYPYMWPDKDMFKKKITQ